MTEHPGHEEPPAGDPASEPSIAQAIQDISERAILLVSEEVELAKAEISAKVSKLIKGSVVAGAAGFFVVGALIMLLNGLAWFLYWAIPWPDEQFFWGFFMTAGILTVLAALAGFIAARAFKAGTPPIPEMAIEEAQLVKESVAESVSGADRQAVS